MAGEAKSKKPRKKAAKKTTQLAVTKSPKNKAADNAVQAVAEEPVVAELPQQGETVAAEEQAPAEPVETVSAAEDEAVPETTKSVKSPTKKTTLPVSTITSERGPGQPRWLKIAGLSVGILALLTLLVSGLLSQYFKGKTLPNVSVAGISSTAKKPAEVKQQLESQAKQLQVSFQVGEKKFTPKNEEIGLQVNIDKTVERALQAKRTDGIWTKLAFWRSVNVPAEVSVNDTLFNQYIEVNTPELTKPPQDSQLQFDVKQGQFVVTPQAAGQGANTDKLKSQLMALGNNLTPTTFKIEATVKQPPITEAKLQPLVARANEIVTRRVILTGLGYTFRARPADIAEWVTPTPDAKGEVALVIDPAKVQSYVDSVSKRISSIPVDRKIIKDATTGAEVIIQEGRDGTELADKPALASAITEALNNGQDTTQTMNIKTATFQTVNMEAVDKWIEVDLSEQRTTAYERATPIKNFLIASGTRGYETVTGEFAIWLKVRKQTMQGGSKADGSYYSIPNVEWVSYFYKDYALHGAWWREKFGAPASHGCVNMRNVDAQWLYEWAPKGTKVIVHQ